MYDWGWSAFTTTVATALLAPYILALAEDRGTVPVLGFEVDPASFFSYAVSLSALLQVVLLPLVGATADHTDHKKRLLLALSYGACAATVALFFVTSSTVLAGGALFVLGATGFAAASVVYNSYLIDIAPPAMRDRLSSAGYAYGYLGGGIYLALNLALITVMDDTGLAVRLSLAGAGVWAAVFIAAFTHRLLKPRPAASPRTGTDSLLVEGFRSVASTLRIVRTRYPVTLRYLVGYLLFNDGIQTVITIAGLFAVDELGATESQLLTLILLIQFLAFFGAIAFGRLAERIGAKQALVASLVVWSGLVIYAYAALNTINQLWAMGAVLALVLGGSQALSRSLYSQLVPAQDQAEYFGFYEIAARGTSWLGPLVFGIVNQVTGSQRQAILSLIFFFVVGLAVLLTVRVRDGMVAVGNDPDSVVL